MPASDTRRTDERGGIMGPFEGKRQRVAVAVVCVFMLGVAGCGDDDDDGAAAGGEVNVVLSEWVVEPTPTSSSAGSVTFVGDNVGSEVHELVVVRSDSIASLPLAADGSVTEDGLAAGALIGEIEDIAAQSEKSVTLELSAGTYVLFCNIVEEDAGETESHFANGMAAVFVAE
jgi:hypothetical protein